MYEIYDISIYLPEITRIVHVINQPSSHWSGSSAGSHARGWTLARLPMTKLAKEYNKR